MSINNLTPLQGANIVESLPGVSLRSPLANIFSPFGTKKILCLCVLCILVLNINSSAQVKRAVIIKADGVSYDLIDRVTRERDIRTGKSNLPWIHWLFYEKGVRVPNFYTRGLSLSAPSWAILETGQHAQIKGNIEYDRFTLRSIDYLNFATYYINYAKSLRTDSPAVEVLDEAGLPMLSDAFADDKKYTGFELLQRGVPWKSLRNSFQKRFTSRSLRSLLDEWIIGFEMRSMIGEQIERDLIAKLADPHIRYLVYMTGDIDHTLHANRNYSVQRAELQKLDALIGRLWTAAQTSSIASETMFVLVSDHGMNSNEQIYSQGYDLISLLTSTQGGGHHVVTKRPRLANYSIKGLDITAPYAITSSTESFYLRGQSSQYPTALIDLDGNERASLHLRDSDLNLLQILAQQLARADLETSIRNAATDTFFEVINRRRAQWQLTYDELHAELEALHRIINVRQTTISKQAENKLKNNSDTNNDIALRRQVTLLKNWQTEAQSYKNYLQTLNRLLTLKREDFNPANLRIDNYISPYSMGESNTIYSLQNYVIGLSSSGLTLNQNGKVDLERSFHRLNYFSLLLSQKTRNNVQPTVSNQPIDFIAMSIPSSSLPNTLRAAELNLPYQQFQDAIWLYAGDQHQALLLVRQDHKGGGMQFRYLPVAELKQHMDGSISFKNNDWKTWLPLKYWDDDHLNISNENKTSWLNNWHTEQEWMQAIHETRYSNAIISLHEHFARHLSNATNENIDGLNADEKLINRWRKRRRRLVEADLLILANDHWNFNALDVNPGGNHGAFFRSSTRSTLMFSGGNSTGLAQGVIVNDPYDSLSFAPTILNLMGFATDGKLTSSLQKQLFYNLPGEVIQGLFKSQP